MSRENPGAFPLFDLLARTWRLPAPPAGVVFDAASRALAAPLIDGRVALVGADDAESPESRMTVDEAGRCMIAPRRSAPRPAIVLPARATGAALVSAAAGGGFVIAHGDGALARVDVDGSETPLGEARGVVALDASARGLLALAGAQAVELRRANGASETANWPAQAVAVSPDGVWLAFGCGETLRLTRCAAPFVETWDYLCPARIERIVWRGDGAYLVAQCGAGGLALVDVAGERFSALGDFPTPPRSAAFSEPANALVASGAYRIAAWDLARPPFDGERGGALETGRAGLVPVAAVAALPGRKLAAAAYANGQIVIAALGARDELILQALGPEPVALVAAPDGSALAVAAGDTLALVSLPEALFK